MKKQTYTPEIKERAVRMLIEAAGDYPSTWSAIQAIAPKIGCTPETLRSCDPGIKSTSIKLFLPQYKRKVIKNASKSLNARIMNRPDFIGGLFT